MAPAEKDQLFDYDYNYDSNYDDDISCSAQMVGGR